jgi:ABC-2 type transport system permease protein
MIKVMKALVKREFWEHRGAFIKAPIIISIVLLVINIGVYITGLVLTNKTGSSDMAKNEILELSKMNPEKLGMFWDMQMMGISTLFLSVLFFVLFFFLLGSLFDDRKDQSILFWKSLPISDASTVLSKMITAMVFVPLVFVGILFLYMFASMIFYTIILLIHGLNPITLVWSPMSFISGFKLVFTGILTQMLWALPIYGWLIFSSSISKRRPFLFAVFVPAIIAFSWYWINVLSFKFTNIEMFRQPLNHLSHALLPFGSGSMHNGTFRMEIEDGSTVSLFVNNMLSSIADIKILYGALFCALMVSLAIWIRRYRNTI